MGPVRKKPIEQILGVPVADMKAQVKISNSFGNKGMILETSDKQLIVSVNDTDISHSEIIENAYSDLIDWKQAFEGLSI